MLPHIFWSPEWKVQHRLMTPLLSRSTVADVADQGQGLLRSPVRVEESTTAGKASERGFPSGFYFVEPHQGTCRRLSHSRHSSVRYRPTVFSFLHTVSKPLSDTRLHCARPQKCKPLYLSSLDSIRIIIEILLQRLRNLVQRLWQFFELPCYNLRAKTFRPCEVWNAALRV